MHHVQVEMVPGHRAAFYVNANAPSRAVEGIFVSVKIAQLATATALAGMGGTSEGMACGAREGMPGDEAVPLLRGHPASCALAFIVYPWMRCFLVDE